MRTFARFFSISLRLFPLFFVHVTTRNNPTSQKFINNTKKIRETFQQLGTTYIKLGQMLSARPDIVGPELSAELRNLLDHEPAIPIATVEEILKTELKAHAHEVFPTFDETPLATASIAQVHKAKLKNGKIVAVKIQRPHIETIIQNDLRIFRMAASLLDAFGFGNKIRFSYIYQQFSDWLANELDFQVEGRRADKFRENMQNIDGIKIPKVYWEQTTTRILTMEFLDGPTLNSLLNDMKEQHVTSLYELKTPFKIHPDKLIKRTIAAIVKQALADRYFHGDMHPANIIFLKNDVVCFVDFGIIGTLDNQEYMLLVFIMLALVENDPESLLKAIMSLAVSPLSSEALGNIHELLALELHKLHEDTGGKVTLNHFITTVFSIARQYNFLWTPGVLLAIKTIGQIDFAVGQIGIKESLLDLMKPEIEKYTLHALSNTVSREELLKEVLDLFQAGKELPRTLAELEQMISSGQISQIARATAPSQGLFFSLLPVGTSLAISYPLLTQTSLATSPYKPILVIAIPFVLFIILSKIIWKREGVK